MPLTSTLLRLLCEELHSQCHMHAVTQKRNARSLALKRVFVRHASICSTYLAQCWEVAHLTAKFVPVEKFTSILQGGGTQYQSHSQACQLGAEEWQYICRGLVRQLSNQYCWQPHARAAAHASAWTRPARRYAIGAAAIEEWQIPRRGLVRQLGKPALLAATYKGDAAAIATAAMEELESTLVDSISQLERFSPGSGKLPLFSFLQP